jgi:hypothetical protein
MEELIEEAIGEIEGILEHYDTYDKDTFYKWLGDMKPYIEHFIDMRLKREVVNV